MKDSKYLSAARSILALPGNEDSWIFIIDSSKSIFLWTDEDVVGGWNRVARKSLLSPVKRRVKSAAEGERMFLTYKDTTVEVPLTHSRDDRLVIVHTLARLVRRDSDIRFCLDSHHSSDLAFLALAPKEWKALEKEFGAEAVAYRFLPCVEELKEFERQAFSRKNNRKYKPLAYAPAAASPRSGTANETVIALEDSSGTLAGYAVLSGPLVATFEFPTCRLVVPRSTPPTPIRRFLTHLKDQEISVALEIRRDRAEISGMFPGYDAFLIKLGKRGGGTWAFLGTDKVLPSGRCRLVLENAELPLRPSEFT